ncbi:MAG: MFS transporter [Polaribacter sp.]
MLIKGDKKLINAWAFYDWANSVYSLVISSAVFPIYYSNLTETFENIDKKISFLGTQWDATTLYDYTLAFSFLIVAFISPILSGIADYKGNKLTFLKRFCLLGSISVMSLYFFEGESTLWIAILFTILASVGFWGSVVFYNAYLPEIAVPKEQDRVSAKGFIFGYTGSIFLLILCLVFIESYEFFHITKALATRYTFLIVGVWWLGFAQFTYRKLPNIQKNYSKDENIIWKGFKELKEILKELKTQPSLKVFLVSFFLFSVGVQTIILMAGIIGTKELELETSSLIIAILLVQFVAILGAAIFSRISKKWGNLFALKTTIVVWGIVCLLAFFLEKGTNAAYYFYGLGALIGLVLGAIQSLSRSTYSKLLPKTEDPTTYFSFYDVTEKIAIVLGMFTFGLLNSLTGSMQYSILCLAIFFIASFITLSRLKKTEHVH